MLQHCFDTSAHEWADSEIVDHIQTSKSPGVRTAFLILYRKPVIAQSARM